MRKTPYLANRMLALVSKAFALAARWGWFSREVPNPGRDHDRYREDHERGSALEADQLRAVRLALENEEGARAEALRLCMLCGARPAEVLGLRWKDLETDGRVARLDAKTGRRRLYLGSAAADVVERQPRLGQYIFPGGDPRKSCGPGKFDPNKPLADLARV